MHLKNTETLKHLIYTYASQKHKCTNDANKLLSHFFNYQIQLWHFCSINVFPNICIIELESMIFD